MSGALSGEALLDLVEPGWRRALAAGTPASQVDATPELTAAAAAAVAEQSRRRTVPGTAARWPACVVVTLACARGGAGPRLAGRRAGEWEAAFLAALRALGVPSPAASAREAMLAHAAPPAARCDDSGSRAGPPIRLDPYGGGIMIADPAGQGGERAALPDEVAGSGEPLLVFDENGVPAGAVLPAEPVWVVYPEDARLRSGTGPRILVTSRLPLTWRGWRLAQADLSDDAWLGLDTGSGGAGRRRPVRGRTRPVLVTGPPLPGVTAPSGAPVFAALPEVLLPPGTAAWRLEARRTGTGAVLAAVTVTATDAAASAPGAPGAVPPCRDPLSRQRSPWPGARRPVLGEVTITASSPGRPGLRRTVVIAEGARVTYFPELRLTTARGLDPAEALLAMAPGMTASPAALPFGEQERARDVTLVAGPVVQRLAVTPPHVSVRVDPEPGSGRAPAPWHHDGPLRLTREDLWRGGALRLDLPGPAGDPAAGPPVIEVTANGAGPVQLLDPGRQGLYPLRRMIDTVSAHGDLELAAVIGGRRVTLATVEGPGAGEDPWAIG
jgi:hypothetical protein